MEVVPIDILWMVVRMMGLWQWFLGTVIGMFYHPNPVKDLDTFRSLISMQFGGWMIFSAKSRSDVPQIVAEKYLQMAKFMLAVVVFAVIGKLSDTIKGV